MIILCLECEKDVSSNARSCPHCGVPVKDKSYSVALLIVFFFGVFGLHHFYLGSPRKAIIWCFIALVAVSFSEFIIGGFYYLLFPLYIVHVVIWLFLGKDKFDKVYNFTSEYQ